MCAIMRGTNFKVRRRILELSSLSSQPGKEKVVAIPRLQNRRASWTRVGLFKKIRPRWCILIFKYPNLLLSKVDYTASLKGISHIFRNCKMCNGDKIVLVRIRSVSRNVNISRRSCWSWYFKQYIPETKGTLATSTVQYSAPKSIFNKVKVS